MLDAFETFSLSIEQIGKNIRKYKDGRAAALGLRGIHVMVLHQLEKSEEGVTATKLAEACGVNRAFVSRIVAELMELGLITYAEGTARPYRSPLVLTERGSETVREMNLRIVEAVKDVRGDIRPREMAIFYAVLQRLDRRIAELVEESTENEKKEAER